MNLIKKMLYNTALPICGAVLKRNNKFINVIYYHDVVDENAHSFMRISQRIFQLQMEYISKHGYKTYTFAELDEDENVKYHSDSVLIVFDDGWRSNYAEIFEFMKQRGLKYNVFLAAGSIGNDPDYLTWEEVEEMAQSGLCGFGAHTFDHVTCEDFDLLDFARQVHQTDDLIEQHTGYRPKDFCFPKGIYTDKSIQRLITDSNYERIYTSDLNYSYCRDGKIIFGRNAISNDESMNVFINKLKGFYNVFYRLRGGINE